MAQFINTKEKLVVEAVDGLLRASGGHNLARLDGFPSLKVVLRADHKSSKVAVVSGGGSGHEPFGAGFVGKGFLTAAVCGEVFASPSVDAVFAALMAVTGKAGCVLIVLNYTGDRLNFGLAVERARALGKKIEVVIVADDIALPDSAQPRGLAGALFAQKIAGYYAEKGWPLEKVAAAARRAAAATVSIGISLSSCTIPGHGREDRVPVGKAELGLGLHGEPGVDLIEFGGAKESAQVLLKGLFAKAKKARSYALLINNLGGCTPIEMGCLTNVALTDANAKKIKLVIGPAVLFGSLDMHGFSFSLLPLTPEFEEALKGAATPLVWPGVKTQVKPSLVKLSAATKAKKIKASRNPALADLVTRACGILTAAESRLNALDAKVGDGDTGSTIAAAARHVQGGLKSMPLAKRDQFFMSVSEAMTRSMGGSSGVLFAIFFSAASQAAASGATWQAALQAGLAKMMAYGGAKPGDRTMVDAIHPALETLVKTGSLERAAKAAREGADATANMVRARAGRSAYLSAKNLKGVNDPGAEAIALLLEDLARP